MTLGELSAYGYFILTVSLSLMFMAYVYHVYRGDKTGERDYEKYSNMALNDEITDELVEKKEESKDESSTSERKI
ncbi:cytochrome c oxidase, cbb3-type, CcoQ subunit [Sulfurimonas sp. MAG313]|nr:cytochrome c oxidase, cbb3-type, CcoQ subunit [Sulfurimonas sp. MAG313]MDF1880828.1 cytochrome c oxidase, cbb3-type, CcoQ subunit [Sulfurimonas sp. MAG313]